MALLTLKHGNADFFIADIFDQTPFKNDLASMEHPVFTLAKKPDLREIQYKNGDKEIKISPHFRYGLPTIFDKDLLLYCASLLMSEANKGHTPPKTIRISPHDYFISTNRDTSGDSYRLFKKSLERLKGCSITTNIKTNGRYISEGFGVVDAWRVIESCKVKNRMVRIEVVVSDWFYNSIIGREMLTINRDYFRLGKATERRLYEIARKHCGNQKQWSISLQNLFLKTGSSGTLRLFKSRFKTIILDNHIPDYKFYLDSQDKVTITRKCASAEAHLDKRATHDKAHHLLSKLQKQTITNAKKIHNGSSTDWSLNEIAVQFYLFVDKKGMPESLDGAFIGFLKKKVKTYKKDTVTQ